MPITIIEEKINKSKLLEIAKQQFGDMVKAVVDIERAIMIIGAELHADEEALLLKQGSKQKDLWGINIYPDKIGEELIEFDSMINLRPSQGNRSRDVKDPIIREKIIKIVNQLIQES
ncbi:MAG: hypothetical protein KR126chlam6_01450 [Candidatus Anoxychlamydiales bacterium]|nr:hypothetical protein [Candidatus Anoxychlamydiales bacterium]